MDSAIPATRTLRYSTAGVGPVVRFDSGAVWVWVDATRILSTANAASLRCDGLGFVACFLRHADIVNHHQGQGGCAVVEHQGAGVERIMRAFRHAGRELARHVERKYLRRDVNRRRTGAGAGGTCIGGPTRGA